MKPDKTETNGGAPMHAPEPAEKRLADFGQKVIETLAAHQEWGSDTLQEIGNEAIERGLGEEGEDQEFIGYVPPRETPPQIASEPEPLRAFVEKIARMSTYGDGPDDIAPDGEDAIRVLNFLIDAARKAKGGN